MDMVVNRLSEIEETSVKIIEEANAQKKELEDEMASDLQEYDIQIDAETAKTLDYLKETLHQEMTEALAKLQADTQQVINILESDYDKNHKSLAAGVVKKLLEG